MAESGAPQSLIPGTQGVSLAQLWAMLWHRKFLIIAIGTVVVALTLVITLLQDDQYGASGTLLVDFESTDPTLLQGFSASLELSYLNTQAQLLRSRRIMATALSELGWTDDPEAIEKFRAIAGGRGSYEDWLAGEYLEDFSVSTDAESRLVDVYYESDDPIRVAQLVNAVIDAYMAQASGIIQGPAAERLKRFDRQRQQARADMEQAQAALTAYQQSQELIDLSERVNSQQERLNNLTSRYVEAQTARQDAAARLAALQQMRRAGASMQQQSELLGQRPGSDGGELRVRLESLTAQRADLSKTLGPNHPRLVSINAEISSLRSQIARSVRDGVQTLEREVALAKQREDDLRQRLDEQRGVVLELERKNDALEAFRRDLQTATDRYKVAVSKYDEVALTIDEGNSSITVVRRAVPATKDVGPSKLLNLIVGCFIGGFLGLVGALSLELIWRRVRVGEDIARECMIPVLAEVR